MGVASAIKLLTLVQAVLLGVVVVRNDPRGRRSFLFALYAFAVGAAALVELVLSMCTTEEQFLAWKRMDFFQYLAVALMLHFSLDYAWPNVRRSWSTLALIFGPAALSVLGVIFVGPTSATREPHGFISDYRSIPGDVHILSNIFGSVASLITLGILVQHAIRVDTPRQRRRSAILAICVAISVMSGIAFEVVLPAVGFGVLPWGISSTTAFLVINPVLTYAVVCHDVLRMTLEGAAAHILKVMSDGLVLTNEHGVVEFVNDTLCRMLNRSMGEILGRQLDALPLRPTHAGQQIPRFYALCQQGSVVDLECMLEPTGKPPLAVSFSSSVLKDSGGALVGVVAALRDVSERVRILETREMMERIFRHDLRNGLGTVIGAASLLQDDPNLHGSMKEPLGLIHHTAEMMVRQTEIYLTLQRIQHGVFKLTTAPVDVLRVLRDVIVCYSDRAKDCAVNVLLRQDGTNQGDEGIIIQGEEPLLFGMVTNLVKNAVEATPQGGCVTVTVRADREVTISVHNPGTIPEPIRDRFFQKFVTYGKHNGTGLGAYSAKLMAEALGGRIWFQSSKDAGTMITVALPCNPVHMD